jgi:hypothetical protein
MYDVHGCLVVVLLYQCISLGVTGNLTGKVTECEVVRTLNVSILGSEQYLAHELLVHDCHSNM